MPSSFDSTSPEPTAPANGERREAALRALGALGERRHAEAALACRERAELERDLDERAAWLDAAEVLDRLAQGKPVAAYMHGHAVSLPREIGDQLVERLANELELADQPLLAMAAFDWAEPSSYVTTERQRLAREIDPRLAEDEGERLRSVAQRVVEHFRDAAEAGDVRALRATAQALVELGRPEEALVRIRRAVELEPGHLAIRLTEVDLLGRTGQRDARRALLIELAAASGSSAIPARLLAEDFAENAPAEAGASAQASYWYAEALARSFDEALVLDFARLLERLGQITEAITQLEAGHARTRDLLWQEEFARELARLQRERGQLQQAQRWTKEVERKRGLRERGYAIAAIALMITLLGVVLAVVLLGG